jgi:ATP-binding cassette, subfamily B, bacterial
MQYFFKILKFSKEFWRLYVVTGSITILIGILSQVTPFLVKSIVDLLTLNVSGQDTFHMLMIFVGMILVVELILGFVNNVSQYYGDILSVKVTRLLSQRYYEHLLSLSQTYYDNELSGKIINRLNRSVTEITGFLKELTNNFIQWFFTALLTLSIIAYYVWPIALLLFMLFPIYLWLTQLSSKAWKKDQLQINETLDIAHGRFAEAIGQIRVVKSFLQEKIELKHFSTQYENVYKVTRSQSMRWHKADVIRGSFLGAIIAFSIGYAGYLASINRLTIGEFTLLLQLIIMVRFPLFAASYLVDNLQRAESNSKDYFEVLSVVPSVKDKSGARRLSIGKGDIKFNNISFAYENGEKVLDNVSFNIKPGKKVALIGQSGEGKSTIANLLLRLYEPNTGEILIDKQNLNHVTQSSLRQNIGVVFQDTSLFSGSVKENISYGRGRVSKAEIEDAAKSANAHKFIEKLSDKYDTQIGERGVKLSGGQKQRLAIARAILKDPPILILDEATSSLDSKAEVEVQKALKRLMKNRTSLIIAHRLSTIKDVDQIISIQNGKIVESGSPKELAMNNGIYAELLALQDPTQANKKKLRKFELVQ